MDSILLFDANSFRKIITMSTSLKTTESIKRAYVEGFLEGLATHGVTPSQIGRAFQTKLAFSLGDTANLALLAAVGTPAVVGYAGGRAIAAARGTEDQAERLRQIKQRQLAHQFRLAARRLVSTTPEVAETMGQSIGEIAHEPTSLVPISSPT